MKHNLKIAVRGADGQKTDSFHTLNFRDMNTTLRRLRTLENKQCFKTANWLAEKGSEVTTASELAEYLRTDELTAHEHLSALKRIELVEPFLEDRTVFYRFSEEGFAEIARLVSELGRD